MPRLVAAALLALVRAAAEADDVPRPDALDEADYDANDEDDEELNQTQHYDADYDANDEDDEELNQTQHYDADYDAQPDHGAVADVDAADWDHRLRHLHRRVDDDADGQVSLGELLSYAQRTAKEIADREVMPILEQIDLNVDGAVSLMEHFADLDRGFEGEGADDEAAERRKVLEGLKFKAADVNGDGLLQTDELAAMFYPETSEAVLQVTAAEALRRRDRDRDGRLSPKEFSAADEEGEALEPGEDELAAFAKLDRDGSGLLDFDEFRVWESGHFHTEEAMKRVVDLADGDGDGRLSTEELLQAKASLSVSSYLARWAEHHELELDQQSSAGEL